MNIHQLILPSQACRQLDHRVETRAKQPGPGRYEYCYTCSLGHEMAMAQLGDEVLADAFVQELRRG